MGTIKKRSFARHCEPLVAKQSIVQDFWIASSFLIAMTKRDNLNWKST